MDREKSVSALRRQIRDAVLDGGVYDGIAVELVGDGFVVSFEEVLIDAVVFIEQLQRGFEPLRQTVNRSVVEALVVNAAHFEDDAEVPGLGEKTCRSDEAVEIHLLVERAGLVVVLEDSA